MKLFMILALGVLMMSPCIAQANEIDKRYITWDEVGEIVGEMCEKIDKDQVEVICGISVGGLVPASLFSVELREKNVVSVSCRSYEGYERGEVVIKNGPEKSSLAGKKVLLVDDIVDSGSTIAKVTEYLYHYYGVESVQVATLFFNESHCRYETPDYWGRKTEEWIVFPWELSYAESLR